MIDFYSKVPSFSFYYERDIVVVLEKIATDYGLVIEYVNVVFVDDDELLEINKQFLNHDYYTDIITFNYSEEPDILESELYISIDRVQENALENVVSFDEELSRVIIHGMLHLGGFEDSSVEEKLEMTKHEDYYLKNILFHVKPGN